MKNSGLKRIFYEGKFHDVEEEEYDHYHLSNGAVIRKNEIVKIPFKTLGYSMYSEEKQKKRIVKQFNKLVKKISQKAGV